MPPVADDIADRFIQHDVNLLRLQAHQRVVILKELQALEASLITAIQEHSAQTFTKARQQALLKQVRETIATSYGTIAAEHTDQLQAMAAHESQVAGKFVNQAISATVMAVGVPDAVIKSLTSDSTILGAPVRKIWEGEAGKAYPAFVSAMRQGILAGETTDQLVRRVRGTAANRFKDGILQARKSTVDMLVRTSAASVLNDARLETFKNNDDVLDGYQALVTLDDRTSSICQARSGFAWDFEGHPIPGTPTNEDFPGPPPWHPSCRTTLLPVLKSYGDMLDDPALDEQVQTELDKLPPETQSSMDGQVAGKLTYEQWLKTKSAAFQQQTLGPGKYALWKEGKISLRDLIDQRGRPLTLGQLKQLDARGDDLGGAASVHDPVKPSGDPSLFGSIDSTKPEKFIEAMNKPHPYSSFLTPVTKKEALGNSLFLSKDGTSGYMLDQKHDLRAVFNLHGPRGVGSAGILKAVEQGAQTLDEFDGLLPIKYQQHGFVVTGRMKFVDDLAPKNWNYARDGRPDVVFMSYEGGARDTLAARVGKFSQYLPQSGRYYTDYDQAKSDSRRAALARTDDRGARRRGGLDTLAELPSAAGLYKEPLTAGSALFRKANPLGEDSLQWYTETHGAFTKERQALHTAIRGTVFKGATPVGTPVSYLLGGGPASGKSTLKASGLAKFPANRITVDADTIKEQLPEYRELNARRDEFSAAFTHEESSALSKAFLREASDGHYHTLFDGTGDGTIDGLEAKVQVLRAQGQKVIANYVTVSTEDALARMNARAQETGRKVPEGEVKRIHQAVSQIFPLAIKRGLFDEFTLWDNTGRTPVKVVEGKGKTLFIRDAKKWRAFLLKAKA